MIEPQQEASLISHVFHRMGCIGNYWDLTYWIYLSKGWTTSKGRACEKLPNALFLSKGVCSRIDVRVFSHVNNKISVLKKISYVSSMYDINRNVCVLPMLVLEIFSINYSFISRIEVCWSNEDILWEGNTVSHFQLLTSTEIAEGILCRKAHLWSCE